MDPLNALSLAGTISQFADFGTKLLKHSSQLYQSSSGSLKAHEELELITGDLQCVIVKLKRSFSTGLEDTVTPLSEDDGFQQTFVKICDEASKIATELLEKLSGLKVKNEKHRRWESLKVAVKAALSEEEIETLKRRLALLKDSFLFGITHLLGWKIDSALIQSAARFDYLDTQTQEILHTMIKTKEMVAVDLSECLTRLLCRAESINQDEHQKTRQMIANLRLDNPLSPSSSAADVITSHIEMLSVDSKEEELLRCKIQKDILQLLKYPHMADRYEQLVEAHPETFDWIFSTSDKWQFPWTDFGKWLKQGHGIYWINGKPASGKSTLMKHIYDDRRTRIYLQEWSQKATAKTGSCCLATFFFWSTGTPMQKSQEGLLRSLLFQVLGKHPELIPLVFPTCWAQLYTKSLSLGQEISPDSWSSKQLHNAFERLICQEYYPLSICFCIDGLDEFSGDTEQLCLFFKHLSTLSSTTKICLSSRPWVEFRCNFEGCASLRLQDLTANDISTYVNGRLNGSAAFRRLAARDKTLASQLAEEIITRAEGVFLWVQVVVDLLLKGINNQDTIPQLWIRLKSFPRELNGLYESMLVQIEPIYFDWISTAFQVMVVSGQLSYDPFTKIANPRLEPTTSNYVEPQVGVEPLTLVEFMFALQEDLDCNRKTTDSTELISNFEETVLRLQARCAGLLEVSGSEDLNDLSSGLKSIRWMHRTSHDFVRQSTIWTKSISDDCFKDPLACFSLLRASLLARKELSGRNSALEDFGNAGKDLEEIFLNNAMIYAHHADGYRPTRVKRTKLLAQLDSFRGLWGSTSESPLVLRIRENFMHEATRYCLTDFVEDMLSKQPSHIQRSSAKELLRLLCRTHLSQFEYPCPTRRMLECLLKIENPAKREVTYMETATNTKLPAVMGDWFPTRSIFPREVPLFIEGQLGIIDAFLRFDVDPSNSLTYLPRNFVLDKNIIQEAVGSEVQKWVDKVSKATGQEDIDGGIGFVLDVLRSALMEEARRQQAHLADASSSIDDRASEDEALGRKRKRRAIVKQEVTPLSNTSDSADVMFWMRDE